MQRQIRGLILAVATALLLLPGCQRPPLHQTGRPAEPPVSAGPEVAVPPIRGSVELAAFGGERKVQADMAEVADRATVSLINAADGVTLSTTVTDAVGAFSLEIKDFKPDPTLFYIVEAVKGLKTGGLPNRSGSSAARIRTIVAYQGAAGWISLTSTTAGDPILLRKSTVTVAAIASLHQFGGAPPDYSKLMGSIAAVSPDTFTPGTSGITQAEYDQVFGFASDALANNLDPFFVIGYNPVTNFYYVITPDIPLYAVTPPAARIGEIVTISGSNFSLNVAGNIVRFNGAQVVEATGSLNGATLQVRVPVGATTGPVTLQIGQTVFGGISFNVNSWDGHTPYDRAGNLYVASFAANSLWQVNPVTGVPSLALSGNGLNRPRAVSVDANDNVYVSNWDGNTILRIASGSLPFTNVTTLAAGNGLSNPWGIALAKNGDVYVANYGANNVLKVPAAGGSPVVIASGITQPSGIAFDRNGNLYVTSRDTGTVKKIDAGGTVTTYVSGITSPTSLAFDPNGKLYISSDTDNAVQMYDPFAGLLRTVGNIATLPEHMTVQGIAFDTRGVLGIAAFDSHSLLTLDRFGALRELAAAPRRAWGLTKDSAGSLYITSKSWRRYGDIYISGRVFKVPRLADGSYGPYQVAAKGFGQPTAAAFDKDGKFYVADEQSGHVYKVDLPGGNSSVYARDVRGVTQMAFDQNNVLYMSRWANSVNRWGRLWGLLKVPAGGGSISEYSPENNIWSGRRWHGWAWDGSNTYFTGSTTDGYKIIRMVRNGADYDNKVIYEKLPGQINSLAYRSGKLYACVSNGKIYQLDPNPSDPNTTTFTEYVSGGTNNPQTIAFDNAGLLYVADYGSGRVLRYPIGGGSSPTAIGNVASVYTLAVEGDGSVLYAGSWSDYKVYKITTPNGSPGAPASFATFDVHPGSNNGHYFRPYSLALGGGKVWVGMGPDGSGGGAGPQGRGRPRWGLIYDVPLTGGSYTTKDQAWFKMDGISGRPNQMIYETARNVLTMGSGHTRAWPSSGDINGALGFDIDMSKNIRRIGSSIVFTHGVQVDAQGAPYILAPNWGVWANIQKIDPVTRVWRRVSSNVPWCGPQTFFLDPTGNMYIPNMRCWDGVRWIKPDGSIGADYSVSQPTGVIKDAKGDLLVTAYWGGAGNAPLQIIKTSEGKTSAEVLGHWPYQPSF